MRKQQHPSVGIIHTDKTCGWLFKKENAEINRFNFLVLLVPLSIILKISHFVFVISHQ